MLTLIHYIREARRAVLEREPSRSPGSHFPPSRPIAQRHFTVTAP
jgi:hypothetical protein